MCAFSNSRVNVTYLCPVQTPPGPATLEANFGSRVPNGPAASQQPQRPVGVASNQPILECIPPESAYPLTILVHYIPRAVERLTNEGTMYKTLYSSALLYNDNNTHQIYWLKLV